MGFRLVEQWVFSHTVNIFIVCAYPGFARALRNVVARKGLHFHEHEFRPKKTSVLSVNV